MHRLAVLATLSLLVAACGRSAPAPDTMQAESQAPMASQSSPVPDAVAAHRFDASVRAADVEAHVGVLASDAFGGRQPGSDGERLTIDYLVGQYRRIGLAPGNRGEFTQAVPYVQIDTVRTPQLSIIGGRGDAPVVGEDIVLSSRSGREQVSIDSAPLVFAGYGISAPDQDWDDYAGFDAEGKAVVVLVNDPGFGSGDAGRFKGREMTYFGRWTYKYEECARQRAAACLIVHDDAAAGYGFGVVQTSFGGRAQFELDEEGVARTPVVGWISNDYARVLFEQAGEDYEALVAAASQPGFQARPLADLALSASVASRVERGLSHNVVAVLEGNTRPDEWVVVTAHWDHLGTVHHEDGSVDIYNGAIDNAIGLAAQLEIAEALVAEGGTERSVMFLPVTLEESGLLGSRYYTLNPVQPLQRTVANINIDALQPRPATSSVQVMGHGQSELDEVLARQAAAQQRRIEPHPAVEAGLYFRSDQFSFAQAGVPGLFFGPGGEALEGGVEAVELARERLRGRYHQPGDVLDEAWVFDGIVQDIELNLAVVRELANGSDWPRFSPHSEFRRAGESLGRGPEHATEE